MPYRDIQPPLVGSKQVVRVSGSDTIIDLQTYLGYMNDNLLVAHGDQSPIFINGVAGESMTIPVNTTSNSNVINTVSCNTQPVVFPTAGTIRKTFTTNEKPGSIMVMAQATFVCVTAQAGVYPMLSIMLEKANANGAFEVQHFWEDNELVWASSLTPIAGEPVSVGFVHFITDVLPVRQYRVTLLAGHNSNVALPNTGQWKIDATGTNTLEFNAWSNA